MDDSDLVAEELLLLVTETGNQLSLLVGEVVDDPLLVNNAPLVLLCRLDLHGAMRPVDIAGMTGLTTGGVSKLVDRLEHAGVLERHRNSLEDERGVLVDLTPKGRTTTRAIARRLSDLLPDARPVFEELAKMLSAHPSTRGEEAAS